VAAALLLALLPGTPLAAQSLTPAPPGPFVVDVRGTTLRMPKASSFYPPVPSGTRVPTRGFGLQAGAQVFPLSVKSSRIGVGVDVFLARATTTTPGSPLLSASSPATTATDTPSETPAAPETIVAAFPDVTVTTRVISPQVSLNFGSSKGWSYLTVGAGPARVRSETIGEGASTVTSTATAINYGAGARWFLTGHLGVGFDLRFHRLSGATPLFAASAGFSLK
jgi:hypothetical protein